MKFGNLIDPKIYELHKEMNEKIKKIKNNIN